MLKSYVGNWWYNLAPEELHRIHLKEGVKDYETTEAFSIGMTLLHITLLKPCFDVYDYEEELIRLSLLANRIKQLDETDYDDEFKDIIKSLLQADPRNRMTSYELFNKLEPHAR